MTRNPFHLLASSLSLLLALGWGTAHAQTINTIAGNGAGAFAGDGGPATAASLGAPFGLAFDAWGNIFIADTGNHRIRKVDPQGNITTVAGNGTAIPAIPDFGDPNSGAVLGDGGLATAASLFGPESVAVDAAGNLFIADTLHRRVRRVDAVTGIITTYAGNGGGGSTGDGGPATGAQINSARGLTLDAAGNLLIADNHNNRVRRVDAGTGIITTVAGNGAGGFAGDGGPATAATLNQPNDIAVDAAGNLFIADMDNHRIRRVDAGTGIITTYAGGLSAPAGVDVDAAGRLYIADTNHHRVARLDPPDGTTGATVAGTFIPGFTGDGGPATAARLKDPHDIAIDATGAIFIADSSNHRIRRVEGSVDAGPDQTVNEGTLVQLDGCSVGMGASCSWSQIAGVPTVTLSGANTCSPSFTAPVVPPGGAVLTFQLTVTDGASSLSDTVDVTVKNVNQAPVADAGDAQDVAEGTVVTLDGSNSFDPDGDSISYSWTQIAGTIVTLSDASVAKPSFDAPLVTSGSQALTFRLTVGDGDLISADEVTIVVENSNHPPTADAGRDASGSIGRMVTLDGSLSSDPDGNAGLSYLWTQIAGPAVTLTAADHVLATFVAVEPGAYTFRLTVSDPDGASSTDEVTIVVLNPNGPPNCQLARPTSPYLWPPNHKMNSVGIAGVTDPNGDSVTINIVGVRQDEPVDGLGDGDTSPDAVIQGSTVLLRAERSGIGNGRYYHIEFFGDDALGLRCVGTAKAFVPHDMKKPIVAVDEGPLFDSTRR